jgi:hypothetical protein
MFVPFCVTKVSYCSQVAPQCSSVKLGLNGSGFALVDVIKNRVDDPTRRLGNDNESRRRYLGPLQQITEFVFPVCSLFIPCSDSHQNSVSLFKSLSGRHLLQDRSTNNTEFPVFFPENREFGRRGVRLRLHPPPRSRQLSI